MNPPPGKTVRRFAYPILLLAVVAPLCGQSNGGELRLKVGDPQGLPVKAVVDLSSGALRFHRSYSAGDGQVSVRNLAYGLYHLRVEANGFAAYDGEIEIRSVLPSELALTLRIAAPDTAIRVTAERTLLDPARVNSLQHLDQQQLSDRPVSQPGRSLPDLVQSQPGWVYEGSAVLHPRGSEYQTQYVLDGVPLTDNRSPSAAPEIASDDVDSLNVYTAGIPAEFGRKMGGVVEVNTSRDTKPGLHGTAALSGGSFGTGAAYTQLQYAWGANVFTALSEGALTDRYLSPPVLQNFTNRATTTDFAARYERDLANHDRFTVTLCRDFAKFLVPDELVQEDAGQLQHRENFETLGTASYQHVFSQSLLGDARVMIRSDSDSLTSNSQSTPIIAFQDRGFQEEYFKTDLAYHHSRHEWKAGVEGDFAQLREAFSDVITDPTQFDPGTPLTFTFPGAIPSEGRRNDLEQAAFVQDLIRFGPWTASLGLRWDHYQLLVNQNAVSPRLALSRYFQDAGLLIHASYDRVFQTPAFENLLIASSSQVQQLDPEVKRLPVQPTHGNYFELGAAKLLRGSHKLEVNGFLRTQNNFADDDLLLNTGVSFPIAFRKATIYGVEAKLDILQWKRLSGTLSESYMVGAAYLPATGGLFFGSDVQGLLGGHNRFWVSQDKRHTVHGEARYELNPRISFGSSLSAGSGLPTEFDPTLPNAIPMAIAEYGQAVVDRVNFAHGRVRPSLSADVFGSAQLWQHESRSIRLQVAGSNLNNRLNLINFAGLFSGNAIAPPRSFSLRLSASF
jgi:hypothetical protein